jgi:hypothetical protein
MKRPISGLALPVVLALLLALCLLTTAAPALAGDPFEGYTPGSQWGLLHEINCRAYITFWEWYPDPVEGPGEHLIYNVVSNDARANGELEVWVTEFEPTEGGNLGFGGTWILTPAASVGHWGGACAGQLGSGFFSGKPYQHIVFASPGDWSGSEEYAGHLYLALHAAQGAPWIMKCWIGP